jgi:hypothetical protein
MKRYVIEQTGYIETSKGTVIIDAEDFPLLKGMSIEIKETGHVRIRPNNKGCRQYLHRAIMRQCGDAVVDHINGNPLDNRKANLRVCTVQEKARNRKKRANTISRYKGVCFMRSQKGENAKRWRAYTRINGKRLWFGYYATEEEAAMAYNIKARELFGEFARLNVIEGVDPESGVPFWALQGTK